jgi:hypothetical protein
MAKFFEVLDKKLSEFITAQRLFFTASAPSDGRINLSPKGMDTFRILDEKTVGYLDLTGSGNETAAHIRENGGLTIMFCSFSGSPLILRLYGQGEVVGQTSERWAEISRHFDILPGTRQIILLKIESGQTSCGFGIPIYEYKEDRKMLTDWAENKGEEGVEEYWRQNNVKSIDGLSTGLFEINEETRTQ